MHPVESLCVLTITESLESVAKAGTSGSRRQRGVGRAAGMAEEAGLGLQICSPSALLTRYHACFIEAQQLQGAAQELVPCVREVAVQMKCEQSPAPSSWCRYKI